MSVPTQSLINTALLVVAIIFPILATLSVIVRFYARTIKSQKLRADDWVIVFTLLVCWALHISTFVAAAVVGVNTTTMNPVLAGNYFLKTLWIGGIFLCIVLTAVKISILLFYRRIFVTKSFKRCVDVMIVVLSGWGIATMLAQILCGDPISSAWDIAHINFRFNYWNYALAVGGMSIVFDVIVLCFPIPVIRHLHMPTQRKISILAIFWLGAFCCIAAAIRFHALYESIQMEKTVTVTNYNEITSAQIWQHIEPSCSIIAACLPTYGNLFSGTRTPSTSSSRPLIGSLRTLFSLRRTTSASSEKSKSNAEWQMLGNNKNSASVEISAQKSHGDGKGDGDGDVEAGLEKTNPYRIGVTREFGSEVKMG